MGPANDYDDTGDYQQFLRDWFAQGALNGVIQRLAPNLDPTEMYASAATHAYNFADAMLAAREK